MLQALREFGDRVLGRGSAAITVPVMDGTLKANRVLDDAEVLAELPGIDDLAWAGGSLWLTAGAVLLRLDAGRAVEVRRLDAPISALAVHADGSVALALAGRCIVVLHGDAETARLEAVAGAPLVAVNALAFDAEGRLLFSDGSLQEPPERWCHDLMALGSSGRAARWDWRGGAVELLQHGRRHAFGVLAQRGRVLVSESWRHRVIDAGGHTLLGELPGYPSRMAVARGGGFWLTCFVCRTQLVEFVLRESAYRRRMMAEIDPRYWIAPQLASGQSFLEPLQGAGVKQMGVLKPWAPPRSYGLVMRVADDGRVLSSMHSQVDGRHHGVTAVAEGDGRLYVACKGSGRLLAVRLEAAA